MRILKCFIEKKTHFWQHQWIFVLNILNWYKIHILWELKKNNINLADKIIIMFEDSLLNTLKQIVVKIKLHMDGKVLHSENYVNAFLGLKSWLSKTCTFHGCVINYKKNCRKKLIMFNMAPKTKLTVLFGKIIYYYFFNLPKKCILYHFKIFSKK